MRRFICFMFAPSVALAGDAAFYGRDFHFPAEYTLSVAAPPELVARPIEGDFDDKGRLYVSESSGSNEPVKEQLEKKPHRVLRLEDTNGDGVFDRSTVFADKLMFPEGVLWDGGSVFVSAPPQIWKLTDTDDDGIADKRESWHDGKTLTGCANDLHGPYAGPDGFLYWCKGAFAAQTIDLPWRRGLESRAAHVWRAKPDGTQKEVVFTAGMDNPVGVAWTPEGDLIVSGTFFQNPGGGKRDGLIHAVRGGVWGKNHDVLDGHPRTGGLMPPMTHLGPAAPCGLCRYGRDLLLCQFNMRKVSRHVLHAAGATWRTDDSDFLSSEHPDFHPTDVLQAPDGSVLVLDTGGWYKLCCPTAQLAKPEVHGAIYRLRRTGGEVPVTCPPAQWKLENPDNIESLRVQLDSPNLQLRRAAIEALARRAKSSGPDEQAKITRALLRALVTASSGAKDERFLEHAILYALLECGDTETMKQASLSSAPSSQKALLFWLSQRAPDAVPDGFPALLGSQDAGVRDAMKFALERVPAWHGPAVKWIKDALACGETDIAMPAIELLPRQTDTVALLAGALKASKSAAQQRNVLEGMARRPVRDGMPQGWTEAVLPLIEGKDAEVAPCAAVVFRGRMNKDDAATVSRLAAIAADPNQPDAVRWPLLEGRGQAELAESEFSFLTSHLKPETAPGLRMTAAEILSRAKLTATQLLALTAVLPACGLLERPLLLKSFKGAKDEPLGMALVGALEKSGALATLAPDVLTEATSAFPDKVRQRLNARPPAPDAAALAAKVAELEKSLPAGDAARGSLVFQSAKAACVTCHQIGYKGGTLGPDLTRTGAIRTRRDFIEALAAPSASFVRSYEPVMITRANGEVAYGIIKNQNATSLTLATAAAVPDVVIPHPEIKSLTAGTASLMPGALDQILSPQELADLVSFLQSQR